MLDFAFFYYLTVTALALLLNSFIVVASTGQSIRGEFKWIFLANSLTNILLSLTQCFIMPTALKWPTDTGYSLVLTSNPLLSLLNDTKFQFAGNSSLCEILYHFIYFRQVEAGVLSICLVPLNRAFAVCWKHVAPLNAKTWLLIALVPNMLPFIVYILTYQLDATRLEDLNEFSEVAIARLQEKSDQFEFCTLTNNYHKKGDVAQTIFLILCPVLSYPIALYCVIKLLIFVRSSQKSIRNTVSNQVLQRQKGILITIFIQSAAPLLIYLPLFFSILVVDNSFRKPDTDQSNWYEISLVHYTISWSPFVDALATIVFIKPYRRALMDYFNSNSSMDYGTESGMISKPHDMMFNTNRRISDVTHERPPAFSKHARGVSTMITDVPSIYESRTHHLKETTL